MVLKEKLIEDLEQKLKSLQGPGDNPRDILVADMVFSYENSELIK